MILLYAWRFPHWVLFEFVMNIYGLLRLVLFEDRKLSKVLVMVLGAWDGLFNQMGRIPQTRRSLLIPNKSDV